MRDGFSEREIVYRAEDLILRLRDVRSCRIITDETGAISEIHVVASSDRPPKMIARDVETALKAELDLQIDYRKIGVVLMDPVRKVGEDERHPEEQIPRKDASVMREPEGRPLRDSAGEPVSTDDLVDERFVEIAPDATPSGAPQGTPSDNAEPFFEKRLPDTPPEPVTRTVHVPVPEIAPEQEMPGEDDVDLEFLEDSTRIGFRGLNLSMEETSIKAEVRLTSNGIEVIGCMDECCGNRPVVETVAGAAVKALVELLDENFHLCLSEVREFEIRGRKALVAVVDMIRGRDSSSYSGCAFVGRDSGEAAVMAVLDAVNRPFGRWKSRREIHYRIR
jgi:hypothetical protein